MTPALTLAISLNAHALPPMLWADALLHRLSLNPGRPFSALTPGLFFYRAGYSGAHSDKQPVRVLSMSAGGRKATFSSGRDWRQYPTYAGTWTGQFHPISEIDLELAQLKHEEIIRAVTANGSGIDVPPGVRREYPGFFVHIPEPFTAEEVKQAITGWEHRDVSGENIDDMIAVLWRDVEAHDKTSAPVRIFGYMTEDELRQSRDSLLKRIAFYRWLKPHVSEGGALYIP